MPGENHVEQLKRIVEDVKSLGEEKGWLGFLAGLNVAIIIIDILLALAALVALLSAIVDGPVGVGVAILLAALALIILILDLFVKWGKEHVEAANDARFQRLQGELERKRKSLEADKEKLAPKPP